LIISGQILREYAHASIREARKSGKEMAEATTDALHNIQIFRRDFLVLYEDEATMNLWVKLLPILLTQKDVFDCNLVAIMQANDIRHILTHNVSDFTRFSELVVIPMFR
jgi:predicted nucleic acid-binding protein